MAVFTLLQCLHLPFYDISIMSIKRISIVVPQTSELSWVCRLQVFSMEPFSKPLTLHSTNTDKDGEVEQIELIPLGAWL